MIIKYNYKFFSLFPFYWFNLNSFYFLKIIDNAVEEFIENKDLIYITDILKFVTTAAILKLFADKKI